METKVCKECREEFPKTNFHRSSKSGILNPRCKACAAKRAREYRQAGRDYVSKYKLSVGCQMCGFVPEHPCQLDLHHLNPEDKAYKGSHKSYDPGWSRERIDNEIAKCIVVCKNCHALETYRLGHWKNIATDISMRQSSAQ